jgi:hypothetical protein
MKLFNSKFLGRLYYKFQIGFAPITYLLAFIGFFTFAKVWQTTFDYYHIPFQAMLVLFPMGILAFAALLGHVMIVKNLQAEMTSLINTEANPEFAALLKSVERLEMKIDELQEKL